MNRTNKKIYWISPVDLIGVIVSRGSSQALEFEEELPPDAVVEAVYYSYERLSLDFVVRSDSFPAVEDGCVLPRVEIYNRGRS